MIYFLTAVNYIRQNNFIFNSFQIFNIEKISVKRIIIEYSVRI